MRTHWSWSLLSLSSLYCLVSAISFENTAIVRTVELGGSLVHVTTTYAIKSLENNVATYSLALSEDDVKKTSWFEVKLKGQSEPLALVDGGVSEDESHHLYDVSLPRTLSGQDTLHLVVEAVQTHSTWAWPATAAQDEQQSLKYSTGLFVQSPYHTKVQRTKVKSPTPRIISYTTPSDVAVHTLEDPVTKAGTTVTYGPYNEIPSFATQQDVTIHYGYDFPVLEISRLHRSAEISHWGSNLNIQDEIDLVNAGPELKGHFSRLTHQSQSYFQKAAPHIISQLTLHLPSGISNTYYYDQIGNVSTSRLRVAPTLQTKRKQYSVLEMKPRYPLLGGWKYNFTLGWDAPLSQSTGWDAKRAKYVAEIPIFTEFPGAVINKAELKIVLPEGATEVEYYEPFPASDLDYETEVTYLDTTGRPSLVFHYKDLTDKHAKSIFVLYKVPLLAHLRKPLVVGLSFFGLFAFAIVARRVDLTIHKKKNV